MRSKHFLIIVAVTLLTSAFVWVRLQIVSISYDIHELQSKEVALREETNEISSKINEAKSPHRLEGIARTHFKMQEPRADQIVVLRDKGK